MAPLLVDVRITKDKETLDVGSGRITAYHWPGHSPGSAVYTTRMEDRLVLFGQDVHGPIHPALLSDSKAYQMSLEKILNLNADVLCEGHFGVYRGKKAVRRFIQSFMV